MYCCCRWKRRVIIVVNFDLRDTVAMYSYFLLTPRRWRFVFQTEILGKYCTCFNFTVVLFPFLSSPWGSVYRFLYSIRVLILTDPGLQRAGTLLHWFVVVILTILEEPLRYSTNWAMKPHIGSEVNLLTSYLPVQRNDVKFIWNNSYLYCGCRWKWNVIIAVNFPI